MHACWLLYHPQTWTNMCTSGAWSCTAQNRRIVCSSASLAEIRFLFDGELTKRQVDVDANRSPTIMTDLAFIISARIKSFGTSALPRIYLVHFLLVDKLVFVHKHPDDLLISWKGNNALCRLSFLFWRQNHQKRRIAIMLYN